MTANQIAYWNYKEQQRSNKVKEAETSRHNLATEQIDLSKLAETNRHNVVSEQNEVARLKEDARYHSMVVDEQQRSNLAREAENRRSNQAKEAEDKRHHRWEEWTSARQTGISQYNSITQRLAQEETHRSNVMNEALKATQVFGDFVDKLLPDAKDRLNLIGKIFG